MDKIIVEVFFPSLQREFDIEIPINLRFHQIAELIEISVSRITNGQYVPSHEAILCDRETGVLYDINLSPDRQCLHNGSRIMIL